MWNQMGCLPNRLFFVEELLMWAFAACIDFKTCISFDCCPVWANDVRIGRKINDLCFLDISVDTDMCPLI